MVITNILLLVPKGGGETCKMNEENFDKTEKTKLYISEEQYARIKELEEYDIEKEIGIKLKSNGIVLKKVQQILEEIGKEYFQKTKQILPYAAIGCNDWKTSASIMWQFENSPFLTIFIEEYDIFNQDYSYQRIGRAYYNQQSQDFFTLNDLKKYIINIILK